MAVPRATVMPVLAEKLFANVTPNPPAVSRISTCPWLTALLNVSPPDCAMRSVPVPLKAWLSVSAEAAWPRSITSVALLVTLPVPIRPVVPPLPNCRVPPLTVVVPM